MQKIIENKIFILLVLFFIGLTPLLLFKHDMQIAGSDGITWLSSDHSAENWRYAWNEKLNTGSASHYASQIIPLYFWKILRHIGCSTSLIGRLWLIFLWMPAGFCMYFLFKTIFPRGSNFGAIAAVLLYIYNTFTMIIVYQMVFHSVYAVFPAIVALFIMGLEKTEGKLYYGIIIGFLTLFFSLASINPPHIAPVWLALFVILLVNIFVTRKSIFRKIFFYFGILSICVLFNLWWMITTFYTFISINKAVQAASGGWNALTSAGCYDVFRFLGFWAFKSGFGKNMLYFPYHNLYYGKSILITFGSYLIPLMVFTGIILNKKHNKKVLYFLALAVIGIFFAKGTNPPFGQLYLFLYEKIPGFWTFREPWAKFTKLNLLSFSVLLGFTVELVHSFVLKMHSRKARYIFNVSWILTLCIILMIAFPILTGESIWSRNIGPMRSMHVKVPQYWRDMEKWLEANDPDSRTFLLPKTGYGVTYNWKHGISGATPVAISLLPNPIIFYQKGFVSDFAYRCFEKNNQSNFLSLLRFLNVKYILHQRDINWQTGPDPFYYVDKNVKEILSDYQGVSLKATFGKLDLYEIEKTNLSYAYLSEEPVLIAGGIESFEENKMLSSFINKKPSFCFTSNNLSRDEILDTIPDTSRIILPSGEVDELIVGHLSPCYKISAPSIRFNVNSTGKYKIWGIFNKDFAEEYLVLDDNYFKIPERAGFVYIGEMLLYKGRRYEMGSTSAEVPYKKLMFAPVDVYNNSMNILSKTVRKNPINLTYIIPINRSAKENVNILQSGNYDTEIQIAFNKDTKINLFSETEFKKWSFCPKKDCFTYYNNGMFVKMDNKLMQGFQMTREIEPLDLLESPWVNFDFSCDTRIGINVSCLIGLDTNGNGRIDKEYLIKNFKGMNLLSYIKQSPPEEETYNLMKISLMFSIKLFDKSPRILHLKTLSFSKEESKNSAKSDNTFKYRIKKPSKLNTKIKELEVSNSLPDVKKLICEHFEKLPILTINKQPLFAKENLFVKDNNPNLTIKCGEIELTEGNICIINNLSDIPGIKSAKVILEKRSPLTELSAYPDIISRKISPSKYKISVSKLPHPMWLVFNEAFDNGWKAYISRQNTKTRIELKRHCSVNGYANAWYVPTTEVDSIDIEFIQQSWLRIGHILSMIFISLGVVFLILKRRR